MNIYSHILDRKNKGQKSFAVLLDPDKLNDESSKKIVELGVRNKIDFFFVGGSLLTSDSLSSVIKTINTYSDIPVIIFPGSNMQIDPKADAILFLSLISGRNPDALIGQHVIAAPILKQSGLEIISTGYMLVDCGKQTTVSYISNTTPIPYDKPSIAVCTAMAGEMLGLKLIYLDGGSGAANSVSKEMINAVHKSIDIPLVVGGGINTPEKIKNALDAGADVIVIGNGIEKDPGLLTEASLIIEKMNSLKVH